MKNLLFLFLLLISFSTIAQKKQLTDEEKIFGLSKIWQEVNYNFAYLNESSIDWDSLYVATIPKVINTNTTFEYYRELKKFISVFHEGHTVVVYPRNIKYEIGVIDLIITHFEDGFYVTGIGKSLSKEIPIGSKIESINGMSPELVIDSLILPYNNTPLHIRYNLLSQRLLSGPLNETVSVLFITPNGDKLSKILDRKLRYGAWEKILHYNKPELFKFKSYGNIGYVKLGSFKSSKIIYSFINKVDSLMDKSYIIIDLRDNGGGTSFGSTLCKFFTSDSLFVSYKMKTRINNAYYRSLGAYSDSNIINFIGGRPRYFEYKAYFDQSIYDLKEWETRNLDTSVAGKLANKKLLILTNNYTMSAAETFIISLKCITDDIVVFGEPTYGSSSQPLLVILPGGGHARIATQKTLLCDNEVYNYIIPDFIVKPCIDDYLNNNDTVLIEVLKYIRSK
jgi:hypothetical protein